MAAVSLYGDHQKCLSSLSLTISPRYTDMSSGPDDLDVQILACGKVLLTNNTTKDACSLHLNGLSLRPDMCHGLIADKAEGISLTIQTKKEGAKMTKESECHSSTTCKENNSAKEQGNSFSTSTILPMLQHTTMTDSLIAALSDSCTVVSCVLCGKQLFNTQHRLSKVLSMPSDSWGEMADMWFCHPDDDHGGSSHCGGSTASHTTRQHPLSPALRDCYIGRTFLWLHPQFVNRYHGISVNSSNQDVTCMRCKTTVGHVLKIDQTSDPKSWDAVQLDIPFLRFSSVNQPRLPLSNSSLVVEETYCAMLLDYFHEQTFRLLITAKENCGKPTPILQIWILAKDTHLYKTDSDYKLQKPATSDVRVVMPCDVVKVLYVDCIRTTGRDWYADSTQEVMTLPRSACLQLLHLLVTSTKTMPRSKRTSHNYYIGYLRRKQKD